ncbi:alpha/beta hydrolase [Pseudomonas poae]|uniref:Alpha/beta hydrolase n=1 Tax=Pseudomonas poae TaxID=200451 RepID=A0A423ERP4_9PSED|nr:alpha/beta hydrolase [Pseudomonas poae]ROM33950.1 alpha/beta hydrolase [Pseudomonas poae]
MTLHTERYIGYRGTQLSADVGGDPRLPAVILLHGGGQTRYSWGRAARELVQTGYHVITLDLRGHGESDWAADGDYSLNAFVADLGAVIATLEHPPALVGASLGGATALLSVGESVAPLAQALVLVDLVPRMATEGIRQIGEFMSGNLDGFASVAEAADAVARYLPHRPRPSSPDGLLKNLRLKEDGRFYWHWDPQFQLNKSRPQPEELFQRLEHAAKQVTIPTLLVRGKQSEMVTAEGVQALLKLIPHAEFVDVEGAGHMVAGDNNDAFNSVIERFLKSTLQAA